MPWAEFEDSSGWNDPEYIEWATDIMMQNMPTYEDYKWKPFRQRPILDHSAARSSTEGYSNQPVAPAGQISAADRVEIDRWIAEQIQRNSSNFQPQQGPAAAAVQPEAVDQAECLHTDQEAGLQDNHWKTDESEEETQIAEGDSVAGSEVHTRPAPQDCRHPTSTGVAGIYLAAGEESGKALGKRGNMPRPSENHDDEEAAKRMARAERTFMVPVNMVESKYRKMPAPQPTTRTMPFRTGLLARMAQKGGVKPPRPCYSRSWADNLLQPICGVLV